MSIFRRENAPMPSASPGSTSEVSTHAQKRRLTHIAPGTRVRGEVSGPTELLIEGEIEGEVRVDSAVIIGTDGVVTGPISAPTVRVGGRVVGNVQASDRVEVAPSGSLEGDIIAPRVVIAEGAFFKGRVEMKPDNKDKSREPNRPKAEKPQGERGSQGERVQPRTATEQGNV
jgi:cytoskeletal protein CcmA (bactofilin family)